MGSFSSCGAVGAVDVRVVPVARFTGVTKLAAAKGPPTAPIIPEAITLSILGIARRCQRMC